MNIVYTIDDRFIPYAAVSMTSLRINQKGTVRFFILGLSLSEENKRKLKTHLESFRDTEVCYTDLTEIDRYFDFSYDTAGFHPIVLSRLLLDKLLPPDIERVLYLDADTLVRGDLADLWKTDMEGCPVGACIEPAYNRKRKAELGLSGQPYCNAGVLLIDLKAWREKKTGEEIISYYRSRNGRLFANDQDAINASQMGKLKILPVTYNYHNTYDYYSYRLLEKNCDYPVPTKKEVDMAIKDPCIVHFLGEERPWREGNTNRFRHEYEKYLETTPFRDIGREYGWKNYFRCWRIFNAVMKPFPMLRLFIIGSLMPLMLKRKHS